MTTLQHLVVPIEWKAADGEDENVLVGYASTFGNVDLGGDVVVRGAFKKSVETINAKGGGIPLLADHVAATASVLGTIYEAHEDAHGLVIKARISKAPSAQDTAIKLREGHLSKMSIGYETMADAWEDRDGRRVRLLKEVKLWETSVVVFPMNPEATISRVKSLVEGIPAAERKALIDQLEAAEAATNPADRTDADESVTMTQKHDPAQGGQEESVEPQGEAPAAVKDGTTPDADGESASAPGEGASGYDKWTSRALLAGRPTTEADPVTVARLQALLSLNESAIAELVPDDPE